MKVDLSYETKNDKKKKLKMKLNKSKKKILKKVKREICIMIKIIENIEFLNQKEMKIGQIRKEVK